MGNIFKFRKVAFALSANYPMTQTQTYLQFVEMLLDKF